ncbi:PREDICTED: zinc finger [Prunus dulcis]|uniref:PREDICTED: zinc finger n=1 Tax=Prunus dulcis TaxID=3755 RepID=A0A5E4G1B7_PRUDU|nr:PREDICTED: zinc finger [Prunus dulcis]
MKSFCKKHDIDMPDVNARYKVGTCRSCQQRDDITMEHNYRVDLFNDTIDYQLEELNSRFSEGTMELLILSSALDPSNDFKAFKIDDICKLAEKFYPADFIDKDLRLLRCQLELFEFEVHEQDIDIFQNMCTLSELCQVLNKTNRAKAYYLIDRLVHLLLTLSVSIAITEREFSVMKHVKTVLLNKMEDEYVADSLIVYIKKELYVNIDSDSIINDFDSLKERSCVGLHFTSVGAKKEDDTITSIKQGKSAFVRRRMMWKELGDYCSSTWKPKFPKITAGLSLSTFNSLALGILIFICACRFIYISMNN